MALRFRLRTLLVAMLLVGIAAGLLGRAWRAYRLDQESYARLRLIGITAYYSDRAPASSGLSWRVHLLRAFGEGALADAFRMDEAWDSPHNLRLLPRMPAIYRMPESQAGSGLTCVHATEIPTRLYVFESGDDEAVPWTKPETIKGFEGEDFSPTRDGVPSKPCRRLFAR